MRRIALTLPALLLAALACAPAAGADCLNSEVIVVADPDAFANNEGGIIRVNPRNGQRHKVSANDRPAGGPQFVDPYNLAYDRYAVTDSGCSGLAVADRGVLGAAGGSDGRVLTVDPDTGERTLVSGDGVGAGPDLIDPTGVVAENSSSLVVVDQNGSLSTGSVVRIDRATGDRTVISQNDGTNVDFFDPSDIVKEASGDFLVVDPEAYNLGTGGVYRIRNSNGRQRVVSNDASPAGAPIFMDPTGIWAGAGLIRVADGISSEGNGADINVAAGGNRTRVSDNNRSSAAPLFVKPRDVARKVTDDTAEPDYVTDSEINGGRGGVFSVAADGTGTRTVLSQNGAPAGGPLFREPWGIILTPLFFEAEPIEGGFDVGEQDWPWRFRAGGAGNLRLSLARIVGRKATSVGQLSMKIRAGRTTTNLRRAHKPRSAKAGKYRLTVSFTPLGRIAEEPWTVDFDVKR